MDKDLQKRERSLWQDYLFVTQEMTKALARDDFPLFEEMLLQREKLQTMIDTCRQQDGEDSGFASGKERSALLLLAQKANEEVQKALRFYYNTRKNQSDAAMAYEGLDNPLMGMRMDKQR